MSGGEPGNEATEWIRQTTLEMKVQVRCSIKHRAVCGDFAGEHATLAETAADRERTCQVRNIKHFLCSPQVFSLSLSHAACAVKRLIVFCVGGSTAPPVLY